MDVGFDRDYLEKGKSKVLSDLCMDRLYAQVGIACLLIKLDKYWDTGNPRDQIASVFEGTDRSRPEIDRLFI